MASFEAVKARADRSGEDLDEEYLSYRAPEGVEGTVGYKGEVSKLVGQLMAGLRSAMSYTDARTLAEFTECGRVRGRHPARPDREPPPPRHPLGPPR